MTNEQAIKELEESYDIMRNHDIDESESYLMQALGMAIKALQTQTEKSCFNCKWHPDNGITKDFEEVCHKCSNSNRWTQADGDLISRQDVLAKSWEVKFDGKYIQVVDVGDILDAPSVVIPHDGDLISRQAVLDGIEELKKSPWCTDKRGNGFEYLITEALEVVADLCIKQASSVEPTVAIPCEIDEDTYQRIRNKPCVAIPSADKTEHWKDFAVWVAKEIFDDEWEYNKDAFAEIACRKLNKLGIVKAKGDEWELVEPQESEE